MNVFLDTETSGLPMFQGTGKRKFPDFKDVDKYNTCRLVSICWITYHNDNIIEQAYYVIKPNNFIISKESEAIHKISQEEAEKTGTDITKVLKQLYNTLDKCSNIIGHNIEFDINVLLSECYRLKDNKMIKCLQSKHTICTMLKGREFMKSRKNPKLSELYRYLYNDEIENAHNAMVDTIICYKCFQKMFPSDKRIFYFKDKKITLTDEQEKITYDDINKNMLIIAAAGSGKTSTIITRIKYLLDNNVKEESIILTTFTRNAANDMREKLFDIMGYKTNVIVGTIDSISKSYVEKGDDTITNVEDYAPKFLDLIRTQANYLKDFKYLFVDEFQDINDLQFNIINEFYKAGVYIIGVGDDSQNIYEFRGSNIKYILQFQKYFENSVIHKLTRNFRSTNEIVNIANTCIAKNFNRIPKTMIASNPKYINQHFGKPVFKSFSNSMQQYLYVLDMIKYYLTKNITEDSICIMSPINKPLLEMTKLLTDNGINNYYAHGDETKKILKKTGHISLNTIHRSKGLEWSIVFLINMNDDQNKMTYNIENVDMYKKMIEANRRLFYVAITRAKRELYILTDSMTNISRFITELDTNLFATP